jgi:hypothetical protein
MSTVTGNDMKQHAPFEVAVSRRDFLDGHRRTDFECGVVGSDFGSIEVAESIFQLS